MKRLLLIGLLTTAIYADTWDTTLSKWYDTAEVKISQTIEDVSRETDKLTYQVKRVYYTAKGEFYRWKGVNKIDEKINGVLDEVDEQVVKPVKTTLDEKVVKPVEVVMNENIIEPLNKTVDKYKDEIDEAKKKAEETKRTIEQFWGNFKITAASFVAYKVVPEPIKKEIVKQSKKAVKVVVKESIHLGKLFFVWLIGVFTTLFGVAARSDYLRKDEQSPQELVEKHKW